MFINITKVEIANNDGTKIDGMCSGSHPENNVYQNLMHSDQVSSKFRKKNFFVRIHFFLLNLVYRATHLIMRSDYASVKVIRVYN